MKIFIIIIISIVFGIIFYVLYSNQIYNPLENHNSKIFGIEDVKIEKLHQKDFLGVSAKNELFEIYLYKIENANINNSYPDFRIWEGKEVGKDNIILHWQNCPLDSQTINLFEFSLNYKDISSLNWAQNLLNETKNNENYYSYVHFSDLEQYFLLYCSTKNELFYIRKKGF